MNDIVGVNGDFAIDNSANTSVVFNFAQQIAGLASTTSPAFNTAQATLGAQSNVGIAPLVKPMDTTGQTILYYQIELLGTGTLNLNGATDIANATQAAAGEVVVSAADFGKLSISTGASGGDIDLFISGNDGSGWVTPAEIYWTVDSNPLSVLPSVDTIVAPSGTVSLANLVSLSGSLAGESGLKYFVSIEAGGGTVNLNGAQDLLGTANGGQIEVSAADLAKLTYSAGSSSGVAVLDVSVTDGTHYSDVTQVPVDVGYSVSATLTAYDTGETPFQVAVTDSAANVFANLDHLEQMMPNWALLGISLTDSGIPTETVTSDQLAADRGVLSIIQSTMVLDVTATGSEASIQGMPNLATVVVYSGAASHYTIADTALAGTFDITNTSTGGITAVSDVTALKFSDYTLFVASQTPSVAGAVSSAQVADLYSAVFARTPDVAGLNYYEQMATANPSLTFINFAESFLSSPEYTNSHSYAQTTAGDSQFITDTYENLLHRAPESAAAISYYLDIISKFTTGAAAGTAAYTAAELAAHAQVLASFGTSSEFLNDVQVTSAHPADAQHWLVLV